MTLPPLTETLTIRALLGDGDPVEALLAAGRTPPLGPPGVWSADRPDALVEALSAFAESGADCFTAPPAADPAEITDLGRAAQTTTATVQLARQAAGLERYVLATIASGFAPADAARLAAAALQGGADALLLHNSACAADPAALITAVRAAVPVPAVAHFAFGRPASAKGSAMVTREGFSPETCADHLAQWAPDAVALAGAPGALPEDLTSVVAAFRARTDLPILVFLPAGPVEDSGTGQVTRPDPPEILAEHAWPLIRSGANLLAGGPGVTPAHLQLLREELDRL